MLILMRPNGERVVIRTRKPSRLLRLLRRLLGL